MATTRCPSCRLPGTSKCGACKAVSYCSKECQQSDWDAHKMVCKSFKDISERPSADARLAILFPHARAVPKLIWLTGRHESDVKEELKRIIGVEELGSREMEFNPLICANPSEDGGNVTYETVGAVHKPFIFKYDNAHIFKYQYGRDDPEFNLSISHCCASGGMNRLEFCWSGPAVAYAPGQDVDAITYSDVVAFLIYYGCKGRRLKLRQGPKVDAVKIACLGEQQLAGSAPYTSVQVPRLHPIFESESKVSEISKAIGMPLITWKQPQTKAQATAWLNVPNGRFSQVAYMHKGIDPSDMPDGNELLGFGSRHGCFGNPPMEWDVGLGTVYVALVDREPLEPELVHAFGDFCEFHMSAFFQLSRERRLGGDVGDARMSEIDALAVAEATPAKWATYFHDWRILKAGVVNKLEVNGRVDGVASVAICAESNKKLSHHLLCSHH